MLFAGKRTEPEISMLSETNNTLKDEYLVFSCNRNGGIDTKDMEE